MEDELKKEIEQIIKESELYVPGLNNIAGDLAESILDLIRKREIEVKERCKRILPYLECSDDFIMHDPVCSTGAETLRKQADKIEKKDSDIKEFRNFVEQEVDNGR